MLQKFVYRSNRENGERIAVFSLETCETNGICTLRNNSVSSKVHDLLVQETMKYRPFFFFSILSSNSLPIFWFHRKNREARWNSLFSRHKDTLYWLHKSISLFGAKNTPDSLKNKWKHSIFSNDSKFDVIQNQNFFLFHFSRSYRSH